MSYICNAQNKVTVKASGKSLVSQEPDPIKIISVTSLEQSIWYELKANIKLSLSRLDIEQLFEPTIHLLYQMVSSAVTALHGNIFRQIIEADFYIDTADNSASIDTLYKNEIAEHGDRNIAKYCEDNGFRIILAFPMEEDAIISISIPAICKDTVHLNKKLANILGYQLNVQDVEIDSVNCVSTIVKYQAKPYPVKLPKLLSQPSALKSLKGIFSQLGYGVICFSNIGTILSVSPSIFTRLGVDATDTSMRIFVKSIPKHFYSDVIWSLALEDPNGLFENYRIRIYSLKDAHSSVLFNVSGYRDKDSIVHTLWQPVLFDEGENKNKLSEGSILNEARIHNITRNYVPQLVEEKAREVVRLGGNKLINEECFIAVLFCDIVGFTAYVEANENEESVIHTLNFILRRISKSVKEYGGLIDKFMGDCVMVLFRNPHDAVIAAHKMQSHSTDINDMRERAGQEKLQLRIGIHWGKVVIGNIGTPERLDWTTIGDVVNTASRIEKSCQPGEVLISQSMCDEISAGEHTDIIYGNEFLLGIRGKREKFAVCYAYLSS